MASYTGKEKASLNNIKALWKHITGGGAQSIRKAMGLGDTLGALPIENGGTGATNAADARVNLGIEDLINDVIDGVTMVKPYCAEISCNTSSYENNVERQCIHTFGSGSNAVDQLPSFSVGNPASTVTIPMDGNFKFSADVWRTASNGFMESFYFVTQDGSPYTASDRHYILNGYIGGSSASNPSKVEAVFRLKKGDVLTFYSTMTARSGAQWSYTGQAWAKFRIDGQ